MRLNDRLLYASAIFCSSALLFLIQPIVAKAVLPRFGGTAGVWTACMLFFQVVLLLGYLYVYCITRYLSVRAQTALHIALLLASASMLPVDPAVSGKRSEDPLVGILELLALSVGLAYFMLSTTGPLLQAWYVRRPETRWPYRLFALSNLASLAALLAYPLGIEPVLPVRRQLLGWSVAYAGFVLLAGGSALRTAWARSVETREKHLAPAKGPLLWIALAACASTLWLAVANHLSQEVAAIPFLWVLPLALYLLSFILCFDRAGWYSPRIYRWLLPVAWVTMGFLVSRQGSIGGFEREIVLFLAALFACCMFCHGELALRKPEPRSGLPFFYLMVALGGALGAIFVGWLAPHVFSTYLELPIAIAGCAILGLALLYGYSSPKRLMRLCAVAVLAFAFATQWRTTGKTLVHMRNFYGVLQVTDSGTGDMEVRSLYNGAILHGMQFLSPQRSRLATAYYGPRSGAGLVLASRGAPTERVGVIGLGAGTLATYGRPGDYFRFYEINPAVVQVASADFHFLRESEARIDVVTGDGRLTLEHESAENFDVLVLDAFSGDSIPVHLLTRQAFELYFRHLRPGGIIAVHLTNRYLDLASVVQAVAETLRKQALLIHSPADGQQGIYEADWSLLSDDGEALRNLQQFRYDGNVTRHVRPWTDQYSNLFWILK